MMKQDKVTNHELLNLFHSILLFAAMIGLLGALGFVFVGMTGFLLAAVAAIPFLWLSQLISPQLVLRMYHAVPLGVDDAPALYQLVRELALRAQLDAVPRLYYVPSQMMNAFSVGSRDRAALGMTDGLLQRLNGRELTGVLAHEMTHIRHSDMRVMGFADIINRVTALLSFIGRVLLLLNLPLLLMGRAPIPWVGVILLIIAPALSGLLELALSRTREFSADLGAAELTGDPEGMASALQKMEDYESSLAKKILLPGHGIPNPSLLRTHPNTEERIKRLLELTGDGRPPISPEPEEVLSLPDQLPARKEGPRWHITGLWH